MRATRCDITLCDYTKGDGTMQQKAAFTVQGMALKCPLCGEQVESGNRHECERDGGVSSRRTWPINTPRPKRGRLGGGKAALKLREPAKTDGGYRQ